MVSRGTASTRRQLATGNRSGQAEALTLVMPMKWWGPIVHRAVYWFFSRRFARRLAFTNLEQLRFISAIRWSLLPPFEKRDWRRPWRRPHEARWHLLFESNFDGDWDDYLDSFGAAAKRALQFIVPAVIGYPGLDSMPMFKSFAKQYDHLPEYYMSAYPTLTAADIRQELHTRYGRFAREAIAEEGFGRTAPQWTTFLLPVKAGCAGKAVRAGRRLDPQPDDDGEPITQLVSDGSFFRQTALVHFARVVVVDQPTRSWLLVTLTHDGPVQEVLRRLLAGDDSPMSLRALLECTEGFPTASTGPGDEAQLAQHLLDRRPRGAQHRLTYAAAPGWTAAEIASFNDDARRHDGWPVPEDCS